MDLGYGSGNRDYLRVSAREGELIKYRDMHTVLVFNLLNGNTVEGTVRWYDDISVVILTAEKVDITLFYHSVMYYVPKKVG